MSNSVFKEYPADKKSDDILDDKLKVDSNLVIVVNKDGSVCVDQNTLKSVLGKRRQTLLFICLFII